MTERQPVPEPDQSQFTQRFYRHYPWESTLGNENPWPLDSIVNLRRSEAELRRYGSEFGIGRDATEPPFIARQANSFRRYATPDEGGRYHGTTPKAGKRLIGSGRHARRW
jgi:hypothetical protein